MGMNVRGAPLPQTRVGGVRHLAMDDGPQVYAHVGEGGL